MSLSDKSRVILEAMVKGHTYEQILVQDLAWTYQDIFQAVAEALRVVDQVPEREGPTDDSHKDGIDEIRQKYPRAYDEWTQSDDTRLATLFKSHNDLRYMAHSLQRQPSAIRSRLTELGLLSADGRE